MILRSVIVFIVGVASIRITSARMYSGHASPIDLVLSIIIGSNLSRTITGNAPLLEVLIVTAFLMVFHACLIKLSQRSKSFSNLIKGKPKTLVIDGEIDSSAMTACSVGDRDLDTAIRSAGGTNVEDVKLAVLERGGEIEVVLKDGGN